MAESDGESAPTPMTETPPQRTALRFGGFAVAGGLAVSSVVHILLVGTALFFSPRLLHPAPATPVAVDLVTPDDLTAAKDAAQDKPHPSTTDKSDQFMKASPAAITAGLDALAFPPMPPPSAANTTSPTPAPATQLADLLGMSKLAAVSGGTPSEYKADLTNDQIAGFAAHVQGCWTPPSDLVTNAKLTVFVRVRLRRDGNLAGDPEPLEGSASLQGVALLKSALATLQHCPAYRDLPADKYDEWRILDLRFSPNGIAAARRRNPVPRPAATQ